MPCAFLILLVSPIQCVYFVIFIIVLQQFDGNILGPKILGDSTGLASFWVLFSILLFGGLFGFMGMVLGVPVFAMLYSIITRLVRRGLLVPELSRCSAGQRQPRVRYLVRRGLRNHGLPVETEYYLGKTTALAQTNRDGAGEKSD